jgi:hypothetical protein
VSAQRERIRKAVESRGFKVKSLSWEPIYNGGEMCGLCGGWTLVLDRRYNDYTYPGDDLYALSADELLADIDWTCRTPPCDCASDPDERPSRHPVVPILGDPQRPLHRPDCEWHIPYRLRWWSESELSAVNPSEQQQ